jgi:hypothetical protein
MTYRDNLRLSTDANLQASTSALGDPLITLCLAQSPSSTGSIFTPGQIARCGSVERAERQFLGVASSPGSRQSRSVGISSQAADHRAAFRLRRSATIASRIAADGA